MQKCMQLYKVPVNAHWAANQVMCKCFIFPPIDVVAAEDATTTTIDCLQIVCGCCGLFEAQSIVIAIFFLSVFCSKWQLHELYFLEAECAALLCVCVTYASFPAIVQQTSAENLSLNVQKVPFSFRGLSWNQESSE